jgi:putative nucleotidyltransferase with HDIG domain
MALAASSRSLFVKKGAQFGLKEKLLWEHSISVGMGCRQIARMVRFDNEETAFTAGLLHDIGKAVLNQVIPRKYGKISESVYNDGKSASAVERETLGFDHSQIGALIAEKWNIAWEMVEAIAYHHTPESERPGSTLSAILAVSNLITKRLGIGLERVPQETPVSESWGAKQLSLDETACLEIEEIIKTVLGEEKRLYEM